MSIHLTSINQSKSHLFLFEHKPPLASSTQLHFGLRSFTSAQYVFQVIRSSHRRASSPPLFPLCYQRIPAIVLLSGVTSCIIPLQAISLVIYVALVSQLLPVLLAILFVLSFVNVETCLKTGSTHFSNTKQKVAVNFILYCIFALYYCQ